MDLQNLQINPILPQFWADFDAFEASFLGMTEAKSFAILVGQGAGVGVDLVVGCTSNLEMEKPKQLNFMQSHKVLQIATEQPIPQACYAYYRRCQQSRKNGQQCKAPAVKGETICHQHAQQAATEDRRTRQRCELLSRSGLGLGDFNSVQRTISAMMQAILNDSIDLKTA